MAPAKRYLVRMVLFLVAVGVVAAVLHQGLRQAFLANAILNTTILSVFLIGVIIIFRSVIRLGPEARWLDAFLAQRDGRAPPGSLPSPRLLAPMARMLGERRGRLTMSAQAMRSMLDGISSRLDEGREISRYFVGLLIFLGLLGTFWGLLRTISSVADVIGNMTVGHGDLESVFAELQSGLSAPLGGMGTAFSASLFGLAGSLVLGFLELQATQAQNRFFNELEDWLAGAAQLGGGAIAVEGSETLNIPAYVQALVEQTAENLDGLQRVVMAGDEGRRQTGAAVQQLIEKLTTLNDHLRTQQSVLIRMAEGQTDLKPLVAAMAEAVAADRLGIDENTRVHIRNLSANLDRLIEELALARAQTVGEIRSEIKLLARTIAALAEEVEQ